MGDKNGGGTIEKNHLSDVVNALAFHLKASSVPDRETENRIIALVRQHPEIAKFQIGSSTFLHHLCATKCSLPTVKAVYDAYPDAIMVDYGDGMPLHVACREAPVDVISFLARAYKPARAHLSGGKTPLYLAVQNHSQRRHVIPILRCDEAVSSLGPMRMEWTLDHLFLLDGLETYSSLCRPKRVFVRFVQGSTASSMLLYYRENETLSVDAWIPSTHLEDVLSRIGTMSIPLTKLQLEFFEGLGSNLVDGIARWKDLVRLDLLRCASTSETVDSLIDSLASKPCFRRLSITRMGYLDGAAFGGLWKLSKLDFVDLSYTPSNVNLVEPLRRLVETTSALKELDIRGSGVSAGMERLGGCLVRNKTLTRLALGRSEVTDRVVLSALEEGNCTLQEVYVDFRSDYKERIDYYCRLNKSGRSTVRDVRSTKLQCVEVLSTCGNDLQMLYGLLRENPAMWASH